MANLTSPSNIKNTPSL